MSKQIVLRPYQDEAASSVIQAWDRYDRVLVSMPTGLGKTIFAASVASAWPALCEGFGNRSNRVLWLAHRDELIWQGADAIELVCGEKAAVEKGEYSASDAIGKTCQFVVSSVQTMMRESRRRKFDRDEFGMVVLDEAHHCPAPVFEDVLNYFGSAKLLGMTATVDRSDEVSLGKIFQTVSFHYDILDAVNDAWLVPIQQEYVADVELDFSSVTADNGDLSAEQLDQIILREKPLHKIVSSTVRMAGNRPTMVFAPSVMSAAAIAELINRYTGRQAAHAVSGATPKDERRDLIFGYKKGEYQFLCSCDLLREGFNAPATACIVMARPTKSRLVYAQAIGRGLRTLDGTLDGLDFDLLGRKQAIAASVKPNCLVIDLVGASKHKLVHSADLLGGTFDAVVVEEAEKNCRQKSLDGCPADVMSELLAAAAKADELRRAERVRILAEAKVKRRTVDPFDVLDVPDRKLPGWWEALPPSEADVARLESEGISTKGLDSTQARQLVEEIRRRAQSGECTAKMARIMRSYGYDPHVPIDVAGAIIDDLKKRNFRHSKWEAIRIKQIRAGKSGYMDAREWARFNPEVAERLREIRRQKKREEEERRRQIEAQLAESNREF